MTAHAETRLDDALILAVDDMGLNLDLLEAIYERAGARVLRATHGEEALVLLRENGGDVDLIVTDIRMPVMDGITFVRRLREVPEWRSIPVIYLTAEGDSDALLQEALSAGGNDFLGKPINDVALVARSESMCRLKRLFDENREFQRTLERKVADRTAEVEMTRDVAMFGFAKMAECRDPETGAHLERIREYTKALADRLAESGPYRDMVGERFSHDIYKSSPLHDIGKVGIPDSILLKPGKLTDDEFAVMKKHATIGGDALREADDLLQGNSFLAMARDVAMYHHERWDGTGYPSGLAGEAIPLSARIMTLVDVYDALISKRVYKDAWLHDKVHAMIVGGAGITFDPTVVEAYRDVADTFVKIKETFNGGL